MGYLNVARPPTKYRAGYIKTLVEDIRTALNYLDETNFPNGLDADILKEKSIFPSKLYGLHFVIPIINLIEAYTTNSTSPLQIGGYIKWDTPVWYDRVQCKLVLSARVTAGTGTVRVVDNLGGVITTVPITNTDQGVVESELFDVPVTVTSLTLDAYVDATANSLELVTANFYVYPK